MAYTEFYVQTTGSNLNAGSTTADGAAFTFASGTWAQATRIFTLAGADLSGVTVGMFASVYANGSTVTGYVGRISAVDDTLDTITIDATAIAGTAPTDGTGDRTLKVGGAWDGPATTEDFPFGFITAALTNSGGDFPRVNIKSGVTYTITGAVAHANNGPIRFQGYTTSVGDGGKATFDGGTSGASYVMLTVSGTNTDLADLIFQNNGATGNSSGISLSGAECTVTRVVVNSVRGHGITSSAVAQVVSCETYACNQSNTSAFAGFNNTATGTTYRRCIAHDNTGSNTAGFLTNVTATYIDCIADTNGGKGFVNSSTAQGTYLQCDAYANTGDGMDFTGASATSLVVENCNFIANGGYGINSSGSAVRNGAIRNCGFGSGTAANSSGGIVTAIGAVNVTGSVTYASNLTPWTAPTTGNFNVTLATAIAAGYGVFTETAASYTGTLGVPVIGASQADASSSGGGEVSSGYIV